MLNENKLSNETMDCLIVSTRIFNATPLQLFNAWEDPTLLKQWWGPKGFTNTFHQFNFEPKGCWDFTMHSPDGTDYYNENVFEEIAKPYRIVLNHLEPNHIFKATTIFEPLDGKTKVVFSMLFESAEECQNIKTFILAANEENFDRLETVLQNEAALK